MPLPMLRIKAACVILLAVFPFTSFFDSTVFKRSTWTQESWSHFEEVRFANLIIEIFYSRCQQVIIEENLGEVVQLCFILDKCVVT